MNETSKGLKERIVQLNVSGKATLIFKSANSPINFLDFNTNVEIFVNNSRIAHFNAELRILNLKQSNTSVFQYYLPSDAEIANILLKTSHKDFDLNDVVVLAN